VEVRAAGGEAFSLVCAPDWTVQRLREQIGLQLRGGAGHVRLYHGGRALHDDSASLREALRQRTHEGVAFVHCSATETPHPQHQQQHVALDVQPAQGFARLREAGFSEQEIEELRQQFAAVHGRAISPEDEERWLNTEARGHAQQQQQMRGAAENRIYEMLFVGLVGGFLFPPVLVFGRDMSKYLRAGLVTGALFNLLFFVIRGVFG
jgi:hypothetical protein